jgi:von Willebrand factor type D domain
MQPVCCLGRGFQIQFDGMRTYIRLDPLYVNNTRGLCGTYDFNSQNDFLTHISIIETNIKTFAEDYKLNAACQTPTQLHPCQQNVVVCILDRRETTIFTICLNVLLFFFSCCLLEREASAEQMCYIEVGFIFRMCFDC